MLEIHSWLGSGLGLGLGLRLGLGLGLGLGFARDALLVCLGLEADAVREHLPLGRVTEQAPRVRAQLRVGGE